MLEMPIFLLEKQKRDLLMKENLFGEIQPTFVHVSPQSRLLVNEYIL